MATVSSDGQRILLGRQKRWPPYWYSTLAGFLEPAESVEEAVRREVWEESGIKLGRVVVHSTQPWPYPANLMIGAIGQAIPEGEKIDLGNDPELEDAKWFTLDEVREALRVGTSGLGERVSSASFASILLLVVSCWTAMSLSSNPSLLRYADLRRVNASRAACTRFHCSFDASHKPDADFGRSPAKSTKKAISGCRRQPLSRTNCSQAWSMDLFLPAS
jgi:ADP-ribose pyrophosphatase YjhB (NUDIX family)